jgi:hypothetical protein
MLNSTIFTIITQQQHENPDALSRWIRRDADTPPSLAGLGLLRAQTLAEALGGTPSWALGSTQGPCTEVP